MHVAGHAPVLGRARARAAEHAGAVRVVKVFARDFADMIQKGRSIKIAGDIPPGTVADLLRAGCKRRLAKLSRPTGVMTSPVANHAARSALKRFEHLGGIRVHVEPGKLVAAHCPDMGEGGRK